MFYTKEQISFNIENIKLTLSDFHRQKVIKPFPLHYHNKNSFEIHYIKDGTGIAILDDKSIEINKGSFFTTGPFIIHGQIPNKNQVIEKYSLHFYVDDQNTKNYLSDLIKKPYLSGKISLEFEELLSKIENEFTNKQFGYQTVIAESLKMMLILLVRSFINTKIPANTTKNTQLNDILLEIEDAFANDFKNITLKDLANKLFMSERKLQRILMDNYNKNFNTMKVEARMYYAENQLLHTDNQISEISDEVGYSSCEHFSYTFKKFFGVTPIQYRKNNKHSIDKIEFLDL